MSYDDEVSNSVSGPSSFKVNLFQCRAEEGGCQRVNMRGVLRCRESGQVFIKESLNSMKK